MVARCGIISIEHILHCIYLQAQEGADSAECEGKGSFTWTGTRASQTKQKLANSASTEDYFMIPLALCMKNQMHL